MATPIGHALAGYLVFRSFADTKHEGSGRLWICMVMAVCPDLDFLPGIILKGQPALYHQGISHSLGFAIGVGLIGALVWGRRWRFLMVNWGLFSMAYGSHLVIDLFGPDLRPPFGLPLFWPISDHYYLAPFQIFWGVSHAGTASATFAEWVSGVMDVYNLGAIAIEIIVILPLILIVMRLRA